MYHCNKIFRNFPDLDMYTQSSRRAAIKKMVAGTVALGSAQLGTAQLTSPERKMTTSNLKGAIHQSVCRWIYDDMSLDALCEGVKKIGFSAIDLIGPKEWPILQKHGIWCPMCNGAEISLTEGWNHPEYHPKLTDNYMEHIDLVATAGYTNLICFSGRR